MTLSYEELSQAGFRHGLGQVSGRTPECDADFEVQRILFSVRGRSH